jgi:predicted dithiol-disulfide oxidoreductase (DUF899 family)
MQPNEIVTREAWLRARQALLEREKAVTRLRDAVNAERMALPWVAVDKPYQFATRDGRRSLGDLFDGRSQLMVYHFMLAPGWEAGCVGCSFLADHLDGMLPHLQNHDVTLIAVSRAPLDEIEAYRRRMGWTFPWVSSFGSDFNYDFGVSFTAEAVASGTAVYNYRPIEPSSSMRELPGLSAFARGDDGQVFHTYSGFARGGEDVIGTLMLLDRAPLGRNEKTTMNWVKRHDEYGEPKAACCAG